MKTCIKCQAPKVESEFPRDRRRPSGYHPYCLVCRRAEKRKAYQANPAKFIERTRQWRLASPEIAISIRKKCYLSKRDVWVKQSKDWSKNHPRRRLAQRLSAIERMTGSYIRNLLRNSSTGYAAGLPIPEPLVEAKRWQIKIKRLLKEKKHEAHQQAH